MRPIRQSLHFKERIAERHLTTDELAGALAGRAILLRNGDTMFQDRHSRVAIVMNPHKGIIVTAFRLTKSQVKHYASYERVQP